MVAETAEHSLGTRSPSAQRESGSETMLSRLRHHPIPPLVSLTLEPRLSLFSRLRRTPTPSLVSLALACLYNWASVSEPHTCDFNATFSLYVISGAHEPRVAGRRSV